MAASSFILAILSKYFVGLYLPTLIVIGLACYLFRRRSNYGLFTTFVAPMGLILGLYAYFYRHDLLILFSSDFGVQAGARGQIFEDIWAELGVATILAIVGAYFAIWKFFSQPVSRSKRERLIWILLIPCLAIFFFAAPLYHLVTANQHVAWKHTIYSLVFLSPLAGFGCASVVAQIRSYQGRRVVLFRLLGAALMIVGMIWFVDYSLDRNWSFQNNWPNVSHVITYLNEHGLSKEDRVLAEGAHIYEYYFDFGPAYHSVWQDTWFMAYDGLDGTSAMAAAIQDRWFDYVVLDDYYTPGMRQMLAPALSEAGYVIGYEETQKLGTGQNILIQVYTLAN
jgi:hypothetical protein